MSRFSVYSLEVEDTSNACQLLAEKTRSVKMLIKYWTNFNRHFFLDVICRPMTDEIYAGLLFQLDLIRNQVTLITKMHADIVLALTPIELASLPYLQLVDYINDFKSGLLRMVVGNMYTVFDDYCSNNPTHLCFPQPSEAEIAAGYMPPEWDD